MLFYIMSDHCEILRAIETDTIAILIWVTARTTLGTTDLKGSSPKSAAGRQGQNGFAFVDSLLYSI